MVIKDTSSQDRVIQRRGFADRWRGFALIGLAIVAVLWFAVPAMLRWGSAERSYKRDRLRYAKVERGDLVRELAVQGRIVAASYPTLFSPAAGRVELHVQAGQAVERGQLLAQIDSPNLSSILSQEQSMLEALEADYGRQKISAKADDLRNRQDVDLKKLQLEAAQRELERARKTFELGLIQRMDFDKANDELRIAQLEYRHAVQDADLAEETQAFDIENKMKQVERQRSVVEEARRKVEQLRITSPVTGVIGRLSVNQNDVVAVNRELLTVIDLTAFEIDIRIPESYADEIRAETKADITYESQTYEGVVSHVSPEVESGTVGGRVVFSGRLPVGLKQNQRVNTRISLSSRSDVLKVKRGPFLESGGGRKVYVVKGDLATQRGIEIGMASLSEVEITAGLRQGETIIISDVARFDDAQTVLLTN